MGAVLKKINDGVYAVEKAIVVISLLMMSVMVFFDVVQRRYTSEGSKLVKVIAKMVRVDPESGSYESLMAASPWITGGLIFLLVFAGFLTASTRTLHVSGEKDDRQERPERRPSAVLAAAYAAGSVGLAWLVLRVMFGSGVQDALACSEQGYSWECGMFPAGIIWSQSMALVLTAWVGFLGASMATSDNRQLKVEAALRYYPEGVRRFIGLLSNVLTAVFCLFLAYMATKLILDLRDDYWQSDGLGGIFTGTSVPQYVGFAVLPIGYTLMALRFIGNGVLSFRGELVDTMGELGDMDLDAIGDELARDGGSSDVDEVAEPEGAGEPPPPDEGADADASEEGDR